MKSFEYIHIVGFAETNFLGNVYYVNHLAWQGRCREMFLRDHAPSILDELKADLRMVTISCHCDYFHELAPFDVVIVRMRLGEIVQNRVTMLFEYWRKDDASVGKLESGVNATVAPPETLIARGEQQIGCMLLKDGHLIPTPVPAVLRDALRPFAAS